MANGFRKHDPTKSSRCFSPSPTVGCTVTFPRLIWESLIGSGSARPAPICLRDCSNFWDNITSPSAKCQRPCLCVETARSLVAFGASLDCKTIQACRHIMKAIIGRETPVKKSLHIPVQCSLLNRRDEKALRDLSLIIIETLASKQKPDSQGVVCDRSIFVCVALRQSVFVSRDLPLVTCGPTDEESLPPHPNLPPVYLLFEGPNASRPQREIGTDSNHCSNSGDVLLAHELHAAIESVLA
jgi:hypothetical protein